MRWDKILALSLLVASIGYRVTADVIVDVNPEILLEKTPRHRW
jgi:hypothetical protein